MKQAELDQLIRREFRKEAKAQSWKFIDGQSYWRNGNLFFQIIIATGAKDRGLHCNLRVKWYNLDDRLWNILGIESNALEPESLRARGAYTIFGHDVLSERAIDCEWSTDWLAKKIASLSLLCQNKAAEIAATIKSIDDYLKFIEHEYKLILARNPDTAYNVSKESILIALEKGDQVTAKKIALERLADKDSGGFIVNGLTFYQHALLKC